MTRAKRISAVPVFIIVLAGWLLTGCDDVESTTELRAEPQSHVTAASDINIIYILTDDQRFDELGFMNPVIDTPNIDKLAQEVPTVFRKAKCSHFSIFVTPLFSG